MKRIAFVASLAAIFALAIVIPVSARAAVGGGYHMGDGRYAEVEPISIGPVSAQTATGNGSAIELGSRSIARLKLNVTAASGTTPNMTVTVQTSRDNSTWYTAGTFTAATGVTNESKIFPIDRFVRASWTITGTTPSFTFTIAGEAV